MMMKLSVILMMMMMMVAVIFAASQSQHNFMDDIRFEAKVLLYNISRGVDKLNKTRLDLASKSGNKCWHGFFCRAEKSLKAVHLHELKRLKRLIEQYNKNHSVSCNLERNRTDTLEIFLTEVKECTQYFKNSK